MTDEDVKTEEIEENSNDELLNLMKDLKDEFKKVSDSNKQLEKRLSKVESSYLNEEVEKPKSKKTLLEALREESIQ